MQNLQMALTPASGLGNSNLSRLVTQFEDYVNWNKCDNRKINVHALCTKWNHKNYTLHTSFFINQHKKGAQ